MKIYMVIQLWFIDNLFCYLIICEMNVNIYVCLYIYIYIYIYIYMTILATNHCLIYI
jgi:hypothetical protein